MKVCVRGTVERARGGGWGSKQKIVNIDLPEEGSYIIILLEEIIEISLYNFAKYFAH